MAVVERECHLSMTCTTVVAFKIGKHGEAERAFLGGWKYFGMAEFTAVPDGMLLVRKLNGVNPRKSGFDGKIFPVLHLGRVDG